MRRGSLAYHIFFPLDLLLNFTVFPASANQTIKSSIPLDECPLHKCTTQLLLFTSRPPRHLMRFNLSTQSQYSLCGLIWLVNSRRDKELRTACLWEKFRILLLYCVNWSIHTTVDQNGDMLVCHCPRNASLNVTLGSVKYLTGSIHAVNCSR